MVIRRSACTLLVAFVCCGFVGSPVEAGFVDYEAGLANITRCSVAWGDYDKDGDLDLAVAGDTGSAGVTRIYRNDPEEFYDIGASLTPVGWGASLAWGDYDNDGDLDLAVEGHASSGPVASIYKNTGGTFANIGANLTAVYDGALAWGDYDNDGDLDLVTSGRDSGQNTITKLYRNDGANVFTSVDTPFYGVADSSVAWADYDKDGDLDIALAGYSSSYGRISRLYRNDGAAGFVNSGVSLLGVDNCSIAWGDYDNDGYPDLALAGFSNASGNCLVYRNNHDGTFSNTVTLPGVFNCSIAWGDYDNDGDLDLATAGGTVWTTSTQPATHIFSNDGSGVFTQAETLTGLVDCSLAWGDFDKDGDLDLMAAGGTSSNYPPYPVGRLYQNTGISLNTAPSAPAPLPSSYADGGTVLNWSAASDAQTPAAGLSYNLRVGSTPGGNDVYSGMALASGTRQIAATGNAQQSLSWRVAAKIVSRYYYWSVQAIDSAMAGSAWSPEATVTNAIISGRIATGTGAAIEGALVTASGCRSSAYTNSSGDYELMVPPGWSGTASASKATWSFTPASIAYSPVTSDMTAQDYTGVQYQISGRVTTASGDPVTEVLVSANNGGGSGTTDASGNYHLIVPGGWSGSVTPTLSGWRFTPRSTDYTNLSADVTDQNYQGAPPFFNDAGTSITGTTYGSIAWGDYNGDGDLDLAVAGSWQPTTIYDNNGSGVLTNLNLGLQTVDLCSVAFCDYDRDNDLDLSVAGNLQNKIYRNDGGTTFTDISAAIPGLWHCAMAWGDFDNDGDQDLAIAGYTSSGVVSRIYRNDGGGVFTDIQAGLRALDNPALDWGDYDNDGDLDLFICGYASGYRSSLIYRNNGDSTFMDMGPGITGVEYGSAAWGDYDADGDLDLAICGATTGTGGLVTRIYRNTGGSLVDTGVDIVGVCLASLDWGDYDSDGDLDLAISGTTSIYEPYAPITRIYENVGGSFVDLEAPLTGVWAGSVAWGDADGDGDLDLAVVGDIGSNETRQPIGKLYRNDGGFVNTRPAAPKFLTDSIVGSRSTFTWSSALDNQTPTAGLSYNLRIGTTPGGNDVFSGMATASGKRLMPALGNAQKRTSWTIKGLPAGTYYWSVQTIDSAYVASPWSMERLFVRDTTAPVISSVSVSPAIAVKGDPITVTVSATDNLGIKSVTADGIALTLAGGESWTGSIPASSAVGSHVVNVVATDLAGLTAANSAGSYTTLQLVGTNSGNLFSDIMTEASGRYMFRVWGRVTEDGKYYFTVNSGAGSPIRVHAVGYLSKTHNGDLVSVRGRLVVSGDGSRVLESSVDKITVLD